MFIGYIRRCRNRAAPLFCARHLLEKLPWQKFLIQGNHDGSIKAYSNYFKTTA